MSTSRRGWLGVQSGEGTSRPDLNFSQAMFFHYSHNYFIHLCVQPRAPWWTLPREDLCAPSTLFLFIASRHQGHRVLVKRSGRHLRSTFKCCHQNSSAFRCGQMTYQTAWIIWSIVNHLLTAGTSYELLKVKRQIWGRASVLESPQIIFLFCTCASEWQEEEEEEGEEVFHNRLSRKG